ncbi:MAG: DUF6298 domain-containing protein [Marinilabiliales bacterium]|nr:DUF6298 domain-containing protein [Marinilabiliales bacterium]
MNSLSPAAAYATAWDGMSKYDLTKYNDWYWNRAEQFADLADQYGLVLIHQHYFQHNILEAGAHWADFWRSANNINGTGIPGTPTLCRRQTRFSWTSGFMMSPIQCEESYTGPIYANAWKHSRRTKGSST